MDQNCLHSVFVEKILKDHVILRNSWGDTMVRIRLHKDDPMIAAFFKIKLKKIEYRASADGDQDH